MTSLREEKVVCEVLRMILQFDHTSLVMLVMEASKHSFAVFDVVERAKS